MSLFKILKGDSSRISTSVTPFHDGYAYFTPDDGAFYIDSEDNGVQRRIRINPKSGSTTISIDTVLFASGWESGKQVLYINDLDADSNGIVGLAQNITNEEMNAARAARLYTSSQDTGSLTVAALGDVPTIDIPVTVIINPSAGGVAVIDAVLLANEWEAGKQTLSIEEIAADSDGILGLTQDLTDDEMTAVINAELYICDQGDGYITVAAFGDIPTTDISVHMFIY